MIVKKPQPPPRLPVPFVCDVCGQHLRKGRSWLPKHKQDARDAGIRKMFDDLRAVGIIKARAYREIAAKFDVSAATAKAIVNRVGSYKS
jgi:hypothetical protein